MTWDQIESKLAVAAVSLVVLEVVGAILVFVADDYGEGSRYVREQGKVVKDYRYPGPPKSQSSELKRQKNQAPSHEAVLTTQFAQWQRPEFDEAGGKLVMASNHGAINTSQPATLATGLKAPSDSPTVLAMLAIEEEKLKILEAIEKWRAAWQAQDVDTYIARYTDTFRPSNGSSHKVWLRDRQAKLSRAKSIVVHLDNLRLQKVDNRRWKVTFSQRYQSPTYSDKVTKELLLIKVGDQYLIEKERVRK